MKRVPNLFRKRLAVIEKQVWYRQRFDACPHFMFFLGDAHISAVHRSAYPFGQRIAFAGFSRNRADWYHSLPELQYTAEQVMRLGRKDSRVSKKMIREFLPAQKSFYALCKKIRKTNLKLLSGQALVDLYNQLAKVYTQKLIPSPLIDGFALATDELLAQKVQLFLDSRGLGKKFVNYFQILTAPTCLSFLQKEELALIGLIADVRKHSQRKNELLRKHQQDFFWMQNNYVKDHVLPVNFFQQRFNKLSKSNYKQKAQAITSLPKKYASGKTRLMKQLHLPKELQVLLTITDDFNAWQDERKKGTFWATHYLSLLLAEFSRRAKYPLDLLKYAYPPEMKDVLTKQLSLAELKKRFDYCMIIYLPNQYDSITEKKFIRQLDQIGTGAHTAAAELRGFAAQLGKVRGRVKVVESAQEIGKVRNGDILVAVMTRPDYLPAMHRAAAFVTDEGGITCHAAIVARELKKPCVIGTKIATKIFKDGDMVEVDANSGIVRKI